MNIQETEHLWIPMPDGVRLAARLWLPSHAHQQPLAAIFEYIPYRKADMVRARDERNHPFFAAHGYACLRVDMRGSGDSEGLMADMYEADELADAHHVINWIAQQPWCNGAVGMFGTSWGGTASLQANCNAPAALKAIIANCATHDRYEDDIHHQGGCLLTDSIEWGATLPAILGSPPRPDAMGEDWFAQWQERLDNLTFPLEHWVREESRGTYWRHGSVKHQPENWSLPILAIGGWSDRYSNSVMSVVAQRPDLAWGIVGPWGHHYPDHGHPSPAMNFQAVALDWWDHWLKADGADKDKTQALDWPKLRLWLREFDPPGDVLGQRNGQMITVQDAALETTAQHWLLVENPVDKTHKLQWQSPDKTKAANPDNGQQNLGLIPHDLRIGQAAGDTGYFGRYGGLPLDQNIDDAYSLCFESAPLEQDYHLCGQACITLTLDQQTPISQLSVRLSDIAPDGQACRVSSAVLNLALDEQLDAPEQAFQAGERKLTINLHHTAYRFKAGHKLRIALSDAYWPLIWPAATASQNRLLQGYLSLSCLNHEPVPLAEPLPEAQDYPAEKSYQVITDPEIQRFNETSADGLLHHGWHQPYSAVYYQAIDTTFGSETLAEHVIDPDDPLSARSFVESRLRYERPDGTAEVKCSVTMTCDAQHYYLEGVFSAHWNGELVKQKRWTPATPRRLS